MTSEKDSMNVTSFVKYYTVVYNVYMYMRLPNFRFSLDLYTTVFWQQMFGSKYTAVAAATDNMYDTSNSIVT